MADVPATAVARSGGVGVGPGAAVQVALLLGPDHPGLGEVVVRGLGAEGPGGPVAVGAALSAGWLPKAVPPRESNEDGVLLAVGPVGALLAVADGHHGSAAAVAALRALAARAPALLAGDELAAAEAGRGAELAAVFATAAHAAVAHHHAVVDNDLPARTALSLVVVTPDSFAAVGFGDTVAAVARHGRLRALCAASDFLGPYTPSDPSSDPLADHPVTSRRRRRGDALVVLSDGVPDFLGGALATVVAEAVRAATVTLAGGGKPPDSGIGTAPGAAGAAARALVTRAGTAGAGDNITAAVLIDGRLRRWPPRLAPRRPT